mmetsp:Transcript_64281/g.110348  ORF Transcript_64281/g.110348 Transcript_64281/m.110348 type:complete len:607 (+) Transcript_64281:1-1821(+)
MVPKAHFNDFATSLKDGNHFLRPDFIKAAFLLDSTSGLPKGLNDVVDGMAREKENDFEVQKILKECEQTLAKNAASARDVKNLGFGQKRLAALNEDKKIDLEQEVDTGAEERPHGGFESVPSKRFNRFSSSLPIVFENFIDEHVDNHESSLAAEEMGESNVNGAAGGAASAGDEKDGSGGGEYANISKTQTDPGPIFGTQIDRERKQIQYANRPTKQIHPRMKQIRDAKKPRTQTGPGRKSRKQAKASGEDTPVTEAELVFDLLGKEEFEELERSRADVPSLPSPAAVCAYQVVSFSPVILPRQQPEVVEHNQGPEKGDQVGGGLTLAEKIASRKKGSSADLGGSAGDAGGAGGAGDGASTIFRRIVARKAADDHTGGHNNSSSHLHHHIAQRKAHDESREGEGVVKEAAMSSSSSSSSSADLNAPSDGDSKQEILKKHIASRKSKIPTNKSPPSPATKNTGDTPSSAPYASPSGWSRQRQGSTNSNSPSPRPSRGSTSTQAAARTKGKSPQVLGMLGRSASNPTPPRGRALPSSMPQPRKQHPRKQHPRKQHPRKQHPHSKIILSQRREDIHEENKRQLNNGGGGGGGGNENGGNGDDDESFFFI